MNKSQSLSNLFTNSASPVPLDLFVANLLLAALLAFLLGWVYKKFGHSLSNRALFARNFILLTMTTMLIITIVKSSLALSLGLVGALSIIRFRAAIKEPEELAYLFLAISVGLGLGAGQTQITLAAFAVIVLILIGKRVVRGIPPQTNLYLTISATAPGMIALPQITDTLKECKAAATLRRFEESSELIEASFHVVFASLKELDECNRRLRGLSGSVRVTYLEERGLGA